MAIEIFMPRLGWTMEEGTFGDWLKQDGESVSAGEMLFTIEGDKAIQEVESFESGILRLPANAPKSGDVLPVGALLAYIVQPGESLPASADKVTGRQGDGANEHTEGRMTAGEGALARSVVENGTRPIAGTKQASSPRARRVARELGVDWTQLAGSGRTGRIVERDVRAAAAQKPAESKLRVTPIAQRMAQEAGIDLTQLAHARGVDKLDRADIEAAIQARTTESVRAQPTAQNTLPVTRIRRLIADRMVESLHTSAPVTLTTEVDASDLVALRQQLKAAFEPRKMLVPSYNDLLIRLTALALQQHPLLNSSWHNTEIHLHQEVNIGLAVDHEDGLLVPVVRNATAKSVQQIAAETTALIEKAQTGKLSANELQDGTFTISNLGMYNIDAYTPVINPPQCAILGVGRIVKKPAVYQEQIVPRHLLALSLTFDHRIVDGAPAARFLDTICQYVETPALWLTA